MTRDEWIERYVAAMRAGGSEYGDAHLRSRAEQDSDTTEERGCTDPDEWELPEVIADEHLESERDGY
nr:hypothetical protein AVHM3334_23410 [Acidovorax sp. SUPP3334]